MCDILARALRTFASWNWLEILKTSTGFGTAIIAWLALQNWKRQSKAQKETAFLDEITDAIHEFIDLIAAPMEMVRFIKIGVSSYSGLPQLDRSLKYPEAVAYIQKQGAEDAKRLYEYLKPCTPILSKIRSLVAKGQVFEFEDYSECQNACRLITQQHEQIQAICALIGNPNWNWQNPQVEKTLGGVLAIDPDQMKQQVEQQNVKFIEFVRKSYAAAYQ